VKSSNRGQPLVRIELRDALGHVSLFPQGTDLKLHKILCCAGDLVEKGQALALIGPSTESTPDFVLGPEHLAAYSNANVKASASISVRRVYGPLLPALVLVALIFVCVGVYLYVTGGFAPSWSWTYMSILLSVSRPWLFLAIIVLFLLRFLPKRMWLRIRRGRDRL